MSYYNRYSPDLDWDQIRFLPSRALQSAELNEIQSIIADRLNSFSERLFEDGHIFSGCKITTNVAEGTVTITDGLAYLAGAIRVVKGATLSVPRRKEFSVGLTLRESIQTPDEDPLLKDPATGTRNHQEPGADRLIKSAAWCLSDDENDLFVPVYPYRINLIRVPTLSEIEIGERARFQDISEALEYANPMGCSIRIKSSIKISKPISISGSNLLIEFDPFAAISASNEFRGDHLLSINGNNITVSGGRFISMEPRNLTQISESSDQIRLLNITTANVELPQNSDKIAVVACFNR